MGRGPIKRRSLQIPWLLEAILTKRPGAEAFTVGKGENWWDEIHIEDVARALILFTEEALGSSGERAHWKPGVTGADNYYFIENGEYQWKDVCGRIANELKRLGLADDSVEELGVDAASEMHPWGPLLWGSNARTRGDKLREELGFVAKGGNVLDSLPEMVQFEARRLKK